MSKPQMLWGKTDWKGKTTSGYRISDQNVPKVPPRNRQILAGLTYKRRETQTQFLFCLMGSRSLPCENLCKAVAGHTAGGGLSLCVRDL